MNIKYKPGDLFEKMFNQSYATFEKTRLTSFDRNKIQTEALESINDFLKSIAFSLAVIAEHLTRTEQEDPDANN